MCKHYGIDIGGSKIEFAIFDKAFDRIHSQRTPTPQKDYSQLLDLLETTIVDLDTQYEVQGSIGIGLPGILDENSLSTSINVPCLNGKNVLNDLQNRLKRPITTINDVRAFALSEANGGAADGYPSMVGVILGTGAASGTCLDGVVRTGALCVPVRRALLVSGVTYRLLRLCKVGMDYHCLLAIVVYMAAMSDMFLAQGWQRYTSIFSEAQ